MKKNILCVCFGNTCRSPMIEELVKRKLKKNGLIANVSSAGLAEAAKEHKAANPKSIETMKEIGISLENHTSTWIKEIDLSTFTDIITVGEKERTEIQKLVKNVKIHVIDLPNPYGQEQDVYDKTRNIIQSWVDDWIL